MVFQALMSMIVLAGIVALVAGKLPFGVTTIIMIVIFGVMMALEIVKYKKIKNSNGKESAGFLKTGIINILILVAMVVLMILRAKGVVAL